MRKLKWQKCQPCSYSKKVLFKLHSFSFIRWTCSKFLLRELSCLLWLLHPTKTHPTSRNVAQVRFICMHLACTSTPGPQLSSALVSGDRSIKKTSYCFSSSNISCLVLLQSNHQLPLLEIILLVNQTKCNYDYTQGRTDIITGWFRKITSLL